MIAVLYERRLQVPMIVENAIDEMLEKARGFVL